MLPGHYYPAFKKYKHFVGNYGNAWWKQREEFTAFNGPIVFTTNCIVPPLENATYKERVFTANSTGYPGCKHIATDAGQCNDSYSLAVIALKLKEVFQLNDINELPIVYNIAWYEQKAVIVLLALLSLGVKHIHLGPTLPAFLSPNVAKVLVEQFGIGGITTPEADMKLFGIC